MDSICPECIQPLQRIINCLSLSIQNEVFLGYEFH
jgi:hypothetical protein